MTLTEIYTEIQTRLDDPSGERYTTTVLAEYIENGIYQLLSNPELDRDDIFGIIKETGYTTQTIANYLCNVDLSGTSGFYKFYEVRTLLSSTVNYDLQKMELADLRRNHLYGWHPYIPVDYFAQIDEQNILIHHAKETGTLDLTILYISTPYIPATGTDELDSYYSYKFQQALTMLIVERATLELKGQERG